MPSQPKPVNPSDDTRPASIHAERTVLGAMLVEPDAVNMALSLLRSSDFSLESHRRIFDVIAYLVDENIGVDIQTVCDELIRQKALDSVGGRGYIWELSERVPRRLHIEAYARTIKDKALLREVQAICDAGLLEASDQTMRAGEVIQQLESRLLELSDASITKGFESAAQVITERYASVDEFFLGGGTQRGTIPTGSIEIDKKTSLLKPGQLVILAARPSMGKTALALNIAAFNSLKVGNSTGIFSLEMESESLLRRILLAETRIPKWKFEQNMLNSDEKAFAMSVLERIMEAPLYIEDTPFTTLQEVRAKARRLKQEKGLDLLILDYLQLLEPPAKSENRTQEVSAMSRGLKGLAKELKIPVIALSQLNRECEKRHDKRPMLSDLRDSGSIEQDADIVAFIYRGEVYEPDNQEIRGLAEVNIAKQRDGPIGKIDMTYLKEYVRFEDIAYA